MARDLFRVRKGLAIEELVHQLTGAGIPTGADADAAPVSSIWFDQTNGYTYQKDTAGSGSDKWVRLANQDDIDSVNTGTSWREPVLVLDSTTYADITAAETAANVADTVDGVTIADTDRILFTDLTTGNENVYIVSGSSGAWTFTEDSNSATTGDTVYVEDGTSSGTRHNYNGTSWVQINQSDLDELGFIRTFVGKTGAGSETPTYSSTNYVANADDLETAIGKLDTQAKANADNITSNDGDITNLQNSVGDTSDYSSNNHVVDTESLAVSVGKLDAALGNSIDRSSSTNITTATNVDSVLVDDFLAVKWVIVASKNTDNSDRESMEILAVHNGDVADATEVDWNDYGRLAVGNTISGLSANVVLSGAGASQVMALQISSTDPVDIRVTRITP
jgi:hypothetical protein